MDRDSTTPPPVDIARSLQIYAGDAQRHALMDRFYAAFVQAGDLVFDVGAHVGDRTACFRRLGARVVSIEPQPEAMDALAQQFAQDPHVSLEPVAVGRRSGFATMMVNPRNPTVSTFSADFVARAKSSPGWGTQDWSARREVPMTTLDALMARHGQPQFIKVDVEGFEDEALMALSTPVRALSFEFTTLQPEVADRALSRLEAFGCYRYAASLGESLTWALAPTDAAQLRAWLKALPFEANSGDVYALQPELAAALSP